MKIDCSITKNFLIERNRLCRSQNECMTCPFYCCNHGSIICVVFEEKIDDAIKIVQTWSDKNQPEIDWNKVPMGTPVLVCDNTANNGWVKRYFAAYLPNAKEKFYAFSNGATRENADGITGWSECELADCIDPTPFWK